MRETEVSYEAFRLGCRACGAQWRAVYRVQRWSDDGGSEHTAWYREGAGSVSPYGGECCDSCGATAEVAAPPWDIAHGRRVGGEAPEAPSRPEACAADRTTPRGVTHTGTPTRARSARP
jgi:hypothetical protein